jgi:hypothetical protein
MLFGGETDEVASDFVEYKDKDHDAEYINNSVDEEFVDDLGFWNFAGSLGDDYSTGVQDSVMELLGNGSSQGESGLNSLTLFEQLPNSIQRNDERLSSASWVLQAYNSGRKGTLVSHPIGFGEVITPCTSRELRC